MAWSDTTDAYQVVRVGAEGESANVVQIAAAAMVPTLCLISLRMTSKSDCIRYFQTAWNEFAAGRRYF